MVRSVRVRVTDRVPVMVETTVMVRVGWVSVRVVETVVAARVRVL